MISHRAFVAIALVSTALACAPAPSSLAVQLRTDLAPGREFDGLTVVVTADHGVTRSMDVSVDTTRSYGRPTRLLDVGGLDDGAYRVSLDVRLAGVVMQTQVRRLQVRGASVVTLVVTRDCAGVMCPTASAPAAEACLGGVCVDPMCGDPGAPACGTECTMDADCRASSIACVTERCVSGQCFPEPDDALCTMGEICDGQLGCGGHALPAPTMRVPANGFATGSAFDDAPSHPQSAIYLPMRWLAVEGATQYQIQIDDSCAIDTFETCPFSSPVMQFTATDVSTRPGPLPVPLTAPVGTRYFVRVRACGDAVESCGPYSTPRYVDVGRQRGDLDGDGYADVAVGHPDVSLGMVHVYRGAATGPHPAADVTMPGPSERFGYAMTHGDFDGSGYASLIVSAVDLAYEGRVYVVDDFETTAAITHTITSPDPSPSQSFGDALAMGDLDADGYEDLVIGAPRLPGVTTRAGGVFVYRGGPGATFASPSWLVLSADTEHGGFGRALAIGDLDGDGVMDLAVSAPDVPGSSSAGRGIVYVYFGHARGRLDAAPGWTIEEPTGGADAEFGAALAIGDLGGDGIADLAIGAPQERAAGSLVGAVYRVNGGSRTPGALERLASPTASSSFFGTSISIVRALGADERGAIAVGAPNEGGGDGAVYLFRGTEMAGGPTPPSTDGQQGWTVAGLGDVDGDGFDELGIGAPEGSGNGDAAVMLGDVFSGTVSVMLTDPSPGSMTRFGWSIAR